MCIYLYLIYKGEPGPGALWVASFRHGGSPFLKPLGGSNLSKEIGFFHQFYRTKSTPGEEEACAFFTARTYIRQLERQEGGLAITLQGADGS